MGSRSGPIGNLPWVRGTSRPGVKKAPRGAEHKEAIKQEVKAYGKGTIGAKFRAAKAAATKVAQEKIPQVRALKEHGVQAWSKKGNYVKGNKIVVKDEFAGAGGKSIFKKKTLPANAGQKKIKNYLGYGVKNKYEWGDWGFSKGGRVGLLQGGKPKLATRGWK